jgi:hypothetical protein
MSHVPGTYNPGNQAGKPVQGGGQRPAGEPGGPFLGKGAGSKTPENINSGKTGTPGGTTSESKMGMKLPLENSVERFNKQATVCFERAESQHEIADLQHANAEKLTILGQSLELNASLAKGEKETGAGSTSSLVPTRGDKTSQKDEAAPIANQK